MGLPDNAETPESDSLLRTCAPTRARGAERGKRVSADSAVSAPPAAATVLRHCRCCDCLNFSEVAGDYICSEHIGGTGVVWATGERVCSPRPDQWHYCARYSGPQLSRDVWVWPREAAQAAEVGAGKEVSFEGR
ncbi:MAG: hypothetical protein ACP5HU_10225 [Phycisphaerae bacterium]